MTVNRPNLSGNFGPALGDERRVIRQFADRPLSEAELVDSFDRLDAAPEREGR